MRDAKKARPQILIAEDDSVTRMLLTEILTKKGYQIVAASNGEEAMAFADENTALAILDLRMPKKSGLEVLKHFKSEYPNMETIVTSSAGISEAVAAMKVGAFWFLQKPIVRDELLSVIIRALEHRTMMMQNSELQQSVSTAGQAVKLIGKSHALTEAKRNALSIMKDGLTLTISGERGTEKLQLARYLHHKLYRKQRPFVVVHLGTIMRNAFDSELFGQDSISIGGSAQSRKGKFEFADGGTLYIEDIGETPIECQRKLALFLMESSFTRVGSEKLRKIQTNIICGTEHNIEELYQQGYIISELYEVLRNEVILPPLRKRRRDIPELVYNILDNIERRNADANTVSISDEAIESLMNATHPLNITGLENIIQNAANQCKESIIQVNNLQLELSTTRSPLRMNLQQSEEALGGTLEDIEKKAIIVALGTTGGNQTEAARRLGISPKTMYNKIKRYEIEMS